MYTVGWELMWSVQVGWLRCMSKNQTVFVANNKQSGIFSISFTSSLHNYPVTSCEKHGNAEMKLNALQPKMDGLCVCVCVFNTLRIAIIYWMSMNMRNSDLIKAKRLTTYSCAFRRTACTLTNKTIKRELYKTCAIPLPPPYHHNK